MALKEGTLSICRAAFSGCSGLVSISIPESITTIGASAFTNCTSLQSVTIPKSIVSMGEGYSSSAFYGCSALKDVTILCPNVGYMWFREVDAIEHVTFGNDVNTIGESAFYLCRGLISVTIPANVTTIGSYAFSACVNLASVEILNDRASIASDAFSGTPWLENQPDGLIYVGKVAYKYKGEMPEGTNLAIKNGTVEIADNAFYYCTGLASVAIPQSVERIGNSAFHGCSRLTSVTIPSSVDSIGGAAFADCSIKEVRVKAEDPISISSSVFSYYSNYKYYSYANLASLYVPDGCKAAYESADVWKDFKEIVEFGDVFALHGTDMETLVGTKDILSIELTNEDEVKLCQFDLRLPEGVSLITLNNGKYDVALTERAESHRVSSTRLSNGDYRFVISSLDNDSFTGNSGTLMNIGLGILASMEAGEYTVKVLNAELCVPDGNDLMVVRPADTESKLTVKAYTSGDVNSDGSVSVTDVGCAINYILEQMPSVFVFEAADMNGDKSVSVTDVGMIINLILNEGAASRRTELRTTMEDARLSLMAVAVGYDLLLEDKDEFVGFQMDVELAGNSTIGDIRLADDGESDHLLAYRQLGNGKWRVVCYSPTNSIFAADGAALLTIGTKGIAGISNIRLTTACLDELRPGDLSGTPTGIAGVSQGMKIGVQGSALCIDSDRGATLTLYSPDGRISRKLSVKKGANRFDGLHKGIYMINNQKVILR